MRPGWEHYHFEQDGLAYDDEYCGGERFFGSENVSEIGGPPNWGMNYYGFVIPQALEHVKISQKQVYDFLRMALKQESQDVIPIRGPEYFSRDEDPLLVYQLRIRDRARSRLEMFEAAEEIRFGPTCLYKANLHGGLIIS
jgi:hypothetical protein